MKKVTITDEFFEKYEDDFKFDSSEFESDQVVEVRIPFEGYYKLKIKCKNPQVAMAEVLKINSDNGIMEFVGGSYEIEDVDEEETYVMVAK